MSKITHLRQAPIFENLDNSQLTHLAQICQEYEFDKGAVIAYQGDLADSLYIVQDGSFYYQRLDKQGIVRNSQQYFSGEHFKESWLFHPDIHDGTVTATSDGEMIVINSQDFLNFLTVHPEVLTKLHNLDFSGSGLSQIPLIIGQLTNLNWLDLSKNNLSELPPEIGQFAYLEYLDLNENNLNLLPSEIGQLSNLIWLYLSGNRLNKLPAEISQLSRLEHLDLNGNNLSQFPAEIEQLSKLKHLDLSGNRLSQLPVKIGQLANLNYLDLIHNPDLPIPVEILRLGEHKPRLIFDFWQEYLSQQTRPLHEVKMILVGEGNVGKTSLVQRLTADKFDPAEAQTKGINIEEWPVAVPSKLPGTSKSFGKLENAEPRLIETHIWDFGGQEIMHATHQFFLTERSLYLLVLDARQGERESRVEYWLSLINSYAAESPILIVLNKCDQHYLDLNRRGLLKKYPNIAGFVRTSAATGVGLKELKKEISQTIATMPHVDTPLPPHLV